MKKTELREGWVSLLLLLAMGLCLAWTLQAAQLAEGIWILQWIVVVGTLVGLALARVAVPEVLAHLVAMVVGAAWSFFLAAQLLPGTLAWSERLQSMRLRVVDWWQAAIGGGESYDSLMFVLFTALLFWSFSYIAAFSIFRTHWVWGAIIPNGTVVLMNTYYNPRLIPYFVSYLLLSLLMLVRFTLFEREDEWRRENVRYSPDLVFDFLQNGAVSALLVIILAWVMPLRVTDPREWEIWQVFEDPVEEVQFHWNRVFASLSGGGPPRFTFFAKSMTLGGPVDLDNTPVMNVESPVRHYWRALTFDQYTGQGWRNTDPVEIDLPANATNPQPVPYQEREPIAQVVRFHRQGENVIFAASQVMQVDRMSVARLNYVPADIGPGPLAAEVTGRTVEISSMATQARLRRNETYTAISLVSTASPSQLRRAGTDYPEWVTARYLQLPDTLPDRVRSLAQRITAMYTTPYDKAVAIERYLRQITYNEAIEAPPFGVDAVDWFLFERREGYCDYYSSAMAVMLRAVGIPARVARGYASGELIAGTNIYVVRELDAHAWPEVFFPNYGWIEYEPTASEPLVTRADDAVATESDPGMLLEPPSNSQTNPGRDYLPEEDEWMNQPGGPWLPLERPWHERLLERLVAWRIPLIILGVLVLIALIYWIIRRRQRASMSLVTFAFDDLVRYARWLGVPLTPHQTPYECVAALTALVQEGSKDAREIANLYVKERYGGKPISVYDEMSAMDAWRRLREAIWVYLVLKYLPVKKETAQSLRTAVRSNV